MHGAFRIKGKSKVHYCFRELYRDGFTKEEK